MTNVYKRIKWLLIDKKQRFIEKNYKDKKFIRFELDSESTDSYVDVSLNKEKNSKTIIMLFWWSDHLFEYRSARLSFKELKEDYLK